MAKVTRNKARLRRHLHVRKKVNGSPERPRMNIFRSITEIYAQVIDDEAGVTLASASSIDRDLRKDLKGLNKSDQASKVGELVAKRCLDKGITAIVFDRGGYKYAGRVKALAESAREAGLKF
jgi:large subunit ribosomal protein L18